MPALLDSGAEDSYVVLSLVQEVNYPLVEARFTRIGTFGANISEAQRKMSFHFELSSMHEERWIGANLVAVPAICRPAPFLLDSLEAIKTSFPEVVQ